MRDENRVKEKTKQITTQIGL